MLFPLHYQCEIESDIDDIGEFDDKRTPEQIQDDVHVSDFEDQPVFEGPQTQELYKSLNESQFINEQMFSS